MTCCFRNALVKKYMRRRNQQQCHILKSGVCCHLILEMDDVTLQRHIRLSREQLDGFNRKLGEMGVGDSNALGVELEIKSLIFLWYMANNNSFRELSDKFNVAQSTAHSIVVQILNCMSNFANEFIRWPTTCEKQASAAIFWRLTGKEHVIGAIDGCHIRIQRPKVHGLDYMNRKGYFSLLLQGVCDDQGRFIDIFVGPPGRVHDVRMLRSSPLFHEWQEKMGNWKLLGDSAYICNDFPFIITPKRDNGRLTEEDHRTNAQISRGRVIIENAFGRMKCRFRRIRDIQNVNLDIMVKLVVAACTLHNLCMGDSCGCEDHPGGCPRDDDDDNE